MSNKFMVTKKEDYNNILVEYCKTCLSLKAMMLSYGKNLISDVTYCGDCGNSEMDSCHIEEYNKMYKEKYKKDYLDS